MTVLFPEQRRRFRKPSELDPGLVASWLRPVFPDLTLPDTARPEIEVTRTTGRIFMKSTLYAGRYGVRAVHTEFEDNRGRHEAVEEYRSQLATLIGPLQGLARAGRARLIVEGYDETDAAPADIAARFSGPPTVQEGPAAGDWPEDDAYLQQFLAAAGPRLQWLREQSAQTGGPAPGQLDLSRDSLVPLWAWAAPRFRTLRDGEQPEPGPKPVWFGRLGRNPTQWWPNETLELMDATLYYLGESLIQAVPGAHWAIYRSVDGGPAYANGQAVVVGFGTPIDLEMYVRTLVGRAMADPTDASALQQQFDILMQWATPGSNG
jgi:hypothetical protein